MPDDPASPPDHEAPEEVRLSREMGLLDATMLGVGALMGGGIFVLVGLASEVAGPAMVLAFLLNTLITIPTLLVYAELGSAFHDAGGGYLWVKEALAQPWGFLGGWISWFSHAVACAVYTLASGAYLRFFFTLFDVHHPVLDTTVFLGVAGFGRSLGATEAFAVLFALFFTWLNVIGIKQSVRAENTITGLVLLLILVFVGAGTWQVLLHPERVPLAFADAFGDGGVFGLFLAMGLTFIAFEGYEIIAQSSEEVKNPKRNIPRAIFLSMAIMAPIYIAVAFVALTSFVAPDGLPTWRYLATGGGEGGELALVQAAAFFLPFGAVIVLAGALLSNLTALNATIYSSSRVSFAMGRDANLPEVLGRVSPKRQTPAASIVASGAIIVGMAVLLPIQGVAAAADIMFLLLFILVNVSFIKLRHTTRHLDYGYRVKWFPFIPLVAIVGKAILATALWFYHPLAWLAALAWLGVGLGVYYAYAHPRERAKERLATQEEPGAQPLAERRPPRILLPVANPRHVAQLATTAADVAREMGAEVHLLYIVAVPRMLPLSEGKRFVERASPVLDEGRKILQREGAVVHTLVRIGHDIPRVIRAAAEEKQADLILLGWRGEARLKDYVLGSTLDPIVSDPPCDIAVLKVAGDEPVRNVFVPTYGGRHAELSVRLGASVGKRRGGTTTLFSLVPPGGDALERAERLRMLRSAAPGDASVVVKVEAGKDVVGAIVREATPGTLVVLGATEQPFWRNQLFGDKPEEVARRVPNVLMVKSRSGRTATFYRRMADRMKKWGEYLVPEDDAR